MHTDKLIALTSAVEYLNTFIGFNQMSVLIYNCQGEEGEYFADKLIELHAKISTAPKTYAQDALGFQAIAHLHYFIGGCNWYITEIDCEAEQQQAFGLADLGYGGEMGYISIVELLENNVELDLHFDPTVIQNFL